MLLLFFHDTEDHRSHGEYIDVATNSSTRRTHSTLDHATNLIATLRLLDLMIFSMSYQSLPYSFGLTAILLIFLASSNLHAFSTIPVNTELSRIKTKRRSWEMFLRIWIEEAEDSFVDDEENLEEGEICLRAVKAFASDPDDESKKRFLCAGALVQRPPLQGRLQLYDAWIADSIMDDGGPNLQKLGALKIIDDLFFHHLKNKSINADDMSVLKSFVIQCNNDNEFTCASYHAAIERGFTPIHCILREEDTIYDSRDYTGEDDLLNGNLFNYSIGVQRYRQAAARNFDDADSYLISKIVRLLPKQDLIDRYRR